MIKILLVRHGQSIGNIKCVFCGSKDYPLTEAGKSQVDITGEYIYKNYKLCALYASELTRAKQTLEKLSKLSGLQINVNKAFNEIDGGLWEDETVPFIREHYPDDFKVWEENTGESRPTGGESFGEVLERAKKGLDEVAEKWNGADGVVVIATHGGVIRALTCALRGFDKKEIKNIPWASNASITEVIYEGGKYSIADKCKDDFLGDKKTQMFMGL